MIKIKADHAEATRYTNIDEVTKVRTVEIRFSCNGCVESGEAVSILAATTFVIMSQEEYEALLAKKIVTE